MIYARYLDLYTHCRTAKTIDADNQVTSWADYEEEDLHKPLPVSTGGSAGFYLDQSALTYYYDDFTPRKGREWSEMEVPIDYSEFTGLTAFRKMPRFIRLVVDSTDGSNYNSMWVYGWIDDISPVAIKGPKSNTLIRWHVDYWLTIADALDRKNLDPTLWADWDVAFGQGRIRRGPVELARPDPSTPRRWKLDGQENLIDKFNSGPTTQWVAMLYSDSTNTKMAYFQPGESTGNGTAPTVNDVLGGDLLTWMGVASNTVIGIWVTPFQPSYTGTAVNLSGTTKWIYDGRYTDSSPELLVSLNDYVCDDQNQISITDQLGNIVKTLPWGSKFDHVKGRIDIGPNGAQAILTFYPDNGTDPLAPYRNWEVEGYTVTVPCIALPLFASAQSDYVFSGQRQYDVEATKNQREQAAWNGIANIGSSIVGGAVAGSVAAPGVGTVAGAIGGAASGIIGTTVSYGLSVKYDSKNQDLVDRLTANQGFSVVQYGGGPYWEYTQFPFRLLHMVRDDVSAAELAAEQTELGYVTDTYSPDCDAFIKTGGPMRIEGLQVRGDVNREGKAYLRTLFERGVNIDVITLNWS